MAAAVDFGRLLKFPDTINTTSLGPDVVLLSRASKPVFMVELAIPLEDQIKEAHERKRAEYQELIEQCQRQGWSARSVPIEVGSRGFVGHRLCRAFMMLGIRLAAKMRAIRKHNLIISTMLISLVQTVT